MFFFNHRYLAALLRGSSLQEENQMKSVRIMALIIMFACIITVVGKTEAEELNVRQPSQNEIGTPATCPVTKEGFKVSKETPVIDYKGKSYFFCCAGCIGDFEKDPEKFAK